MAIDASEPADRRVLVVACGALAREIATVIERSGAVHVDVTTIPSGLHQRPERIADAVAERIRERRATAAASGTPPPTFFVAYGDCGTGGALDRLLASDEFAGIERLPGDHCYEFFSGSAAFAALAEEELGTFYLTDFLAKAFEKLVWAGLGLDRHPELAELYFGNYTRLVYLAQTDDPAIVAKARAAAEKLGLRFEIRHTGLDPFAVAMAPATIAPATIAPATTPPSTTKPAPKRSAA